MLGLQNLKRSYLLAAVHTKVFIKKRCDIENWPDTNIGRS